MICTPSFYRGETNARPSSYPERRERRGLSHSTGMESNVQKQKCIIGPCDLMSTHPQQIRQERNRAAVGGLNDLSFVRCDALALLPATAVISCLLRRSIRGGGGGAGPTVSIAAYDRPSPLVRVGDRRRRRHHTRYQSPISPCHVNLQSERSGGGGIVPRVGSDEGERAGLGASGAGGGEGGSLRSALRRRRRLRRVVERPNSIFERRRCEGM